ncbi:uncharacterized protein LTR77_007221 [Saxophila tyrrhenica]|uniref:Rhodopsin domain-containing protein n=1 Tax=Saxophila tyrrhenica TaxID=1690608 RepID=A0AAV9P7W8_9PEZI|nr:hypothetical protein LTR77_007221 [Saxophila tyrrhenica]
MGSGVRLPGLGSMHSCTRVLGLVLDFGYVLCIRCALVSNISEVVGQADHATATGVKRQGPFLAVYTTHASLNLVFDLAVLLCALPMFARHNRSRRESISLFALLTVGTWIIVVSAWRLGTIVQHGAGWGGSDEPMDFTYYAPIMILLSGAEVGTAVFAASIPVFWPVIESKWLGVLVTQEIVVTEQHRNGEQGLELERSSTHSGAGSTRSLNRSTGTRAAQYYRNAQLGGYVDPFKNEEQIQVTPFGYTAEVPQQQRRDRDKYETIHGS